MEDGCGLRMLWRVSSGTSKQNIHDEGTNKFNERPGCEISTIVCPLCYFLFSSFNKNTIYRYNIDSEMYSDVLSLPSISYYKKINKNQIISKF